MFTKSEKLTATINMSLLVFISNKKACSTSL